jgi:hypothetical protein
LNSRDSTGVAKDQIAILEVHCRSTEAHSGAVEAHPWVQEANTGVNEASLGNSFQICKGSHWNSGGSLLNHRGSNFISVFRWCLVNHNVKALILFKAKYIFLNFRIVYAFKRNNLKFSDLHYFINITFSIFLYVDNALKSHCFRIGSKFLTII